MFKRNHILGMLTLTASLTLFTGVASAQVKIDRSKLKDVKVVRKIQVEKPLKKLQLRVLDLAAHRIEFKILRKTTKFSGTVKITGVVRNTGTMTFRSGRGQAMAYLYEGSKLVARKQITHMTPGQELELCIFRSWSQSNEFPPTYKLMLAWDPDIKIDGNKSNDDMRRSNDVKTRTGYDMQREWRQLERLEQLRKAAKKRIKLPKKRK